MFFALASTLSVTVINHFPRHFNGACLHDALSSNCGASGGPTIVLRAIRCAIIKRSPPARHFSLDSTEREGTESDVQEDCANEPDLEGINAESAWAKRRAQAFQRIRSQLLCL